MLFLMDFSRPDNARAINRLKVLSAIREHEVMTRAELSRLLLINKVSISEIVDNLIKQDLVKEGDKVFPDSGRPATTLKINAERGRVIGLYIRATGCLIASSNLDGKILRLERFPRGSGEEELEENLRMSLERILKNDGIKVYGCVIACDEDVKFLQESVPFDCKFVPSLEAQVVSELRHGADTLNNILFVNLSEAISAAFFDGRIRQIKDFAHLRIANGKTCSCGKNGCLETFFSGKYLKDGFKEKTGINLDTKSMLQDPKALEYIRENLKMLALALGMAVQAIGAESVMLIGEYAALPDEFYAQLNSNVLSILPENRNNLVIFKSLSSGNGAIEGACHMALDEFFYSKGLLDALAKLENYR